MILLFFFWLFKHVFMLNRCPVVIILVFCAFIVQTWAFQKLLIILGCHLEHVQYYNFKGDFVCLLLLLGQGNTGTLFVDTAFMLDFSPSNQTLYIINPFSLCELQSTL